MATALRGAGREASFSRQQSSRGPSSMISRTVLGPTRVPLSNALSAPTRKSFTLFWAALFVLSLGLQYGRLAEPPGVFAAPSSSAATFVDYAQCANGQPPSTALDCPEGWIFGILQPNNSHYSEDEVTPQRAEVTVPAASPTTGRTLTFRYQARKGSAGVHAYDSLATWNYTQTSADKDQGLNLADIVGGSPSTFPIPNDPQVLAPYTSPSGATQDHQLSGQVFTMYGGTITGASAPVHDCVDTGKCDDSSVDDYATITITYSVPDTTTDLKVQLLFGGHLAASTGPRGWGAGLGASSISGGPYHIKWDMADGESIGQRDNQIMAGAIIPPPTTPP